MINQLYQMLLSSDKESNNLALGILEANAKSYTLEEISVFWLLLVSIDNRFYEQVLKILHIEYVSNDDLSKVLNWPGWFKFKTNYITYSEAKRAVETKYKDSLYLIERRRIWK